MRAAKNKLLLFAALVLGITMLGADRATAVGGLTLTPATLTLRLPSGTNQQTAEFKITNSYETPISLTFAIESADYLRLGQTQATIGANQSLTETITLTDNAKLSPGSQQVDLIITQLNSIQGPTVGVLPSIHMPLIIIKEAGAVSSLALTEFSTPRLGLTLPSSLTVGLRNTGNTISIPRGFITITNPSGSVVSKGVLNTTSSAVAPGDKLSLSTSLTQLEHSLWPGMYRATLQHGLGGGQKASVASVQFFYIAWWHIASLIVLGGALFSGVRHLFKRRRAQAPARDPPPKKILLIGRELS